LDQQLLNKGGRVLLPLTVQEEQTTPAKGNPSHDGPKLVLPFVLYLTKSIEIEDRGDLAVGGARRIPKVG